MSKTEKDKIAKQTGIKGLPGLSRVGSLDYARSSVWEWFHLFLENIIPNLVDFWTGQFKDLGTGKEDFEIAPEIWQEIGRETAAAVRHIPSTFVHVLVNIATNCSLFTAESWGFWFVHLALKLLEGRFPKHKYYTHMCELVEIMKVTLQFSIPLKQLDDIEARMIDWVQKYEKYVFHMPVECIVMLMTCPEILLSIRHRATACLHAHGPWSITCRTRYSRLWTSVDHLDLSHGALLWDAPELTPFMQPPLE